MTSAGGATTPGQRPYNEDAFLVRDLSDLQASLNGIRVFMVVSDGMGGHEAGDVASQVVVDVANNYVETLVAAAQQERVEFDPAQALREITALAHQGVRQAASDRGAASMGATFVALFASDTQGWVAHVGDSRAYLLGEDKPGQLTTDHSQVARLVAEGVLTEHEARNHPQRNVIERALGFERNEPELSTFRVEPWSAVVLCTDGFSDAIPPDTMVTLAKSTGSAGEAAQTLADEAQRAGADDNATVAIWAPHWLIFTQASRVAPRRPPTVIMSAMAVPAPKSRPPALEAWLWARSRRRRWRRRLRLAAVILFLVVVAGLVWLIIDAGNSGQRERPAASPTRQTSMISTPTPLTGYGSALPHRERAVCAKDAVREHVAHVRASPSLNASVKYTISDPAGVVWCYRRDDDGTSVPWHGTRSRIWWKISFSNEGLRESGWVSDWLISLKPLEAATP